MKISYLLNQIYPCILYGIISVQLTFAMKWLLQGRKHLGLNTALGYQQIIIIILCSIIDKFRPNTTNSNIKNNVDNINITPKDKLSLIETLKKEMNQRKDMLIFSIIYFLNTLSGTKAHSSLPIPMFLALRRTLIFFVFIVTLIMGKSQKPLNNLTKTSIFLITFGALFAGAQSLDYNILGYLLCFFNNSLSAISLQLTKNYNESQNMSPYQIVVKNSINILPFFFIISFSTGELQNVWTSGEIFEPQIIFLINYVALLGFFHQYTTNLCSAKCSPLALAVTQSVKDLISTITSLVFFQDMEINIYSVGGLIISFLGSFFFIWNKYQEVQADYLRNINEKKINQSDLQEQQQQQINDKQLIKNVVIEKQNESQQSQIITERNMKS